MQKEVFLMAGLGNPGKEYIFTRHNIGFRVLENWLANTSLKNINYPGNLVMDKKHQAKIAKVKMPKQEIILVEPQTFMNRSGYSIKSVINYYKIPLENIIIIHDDLSFPLGEFKFSQNAGPAGHNGIKSIINHLGTKNFSRLRIGIASVDDSCPVNHQGGHNFVLAKFTTEEEEIMTHLFSDTADILNYYLENGFDKTANKFN
jgi:PTH1 family peptidyl-tRNA hydrolase